MNLAALAGFESGVRNKYMHQILKLTMLVKAKVAGSLFLILAFCSISWLSLGSAQGGRTGCPMHHQQSIPSDAPIDHRCCQSEHGATLLQKPANPQDDFATFALVTSDRKPILHDLFTLSRDEAASPETPPAKLQLRI